MLIQHHFLKVKHHISGTANIVFLIFSKRDDEQKQMVPNAARSLRKPTDMCDVTNHALVTDYKPPPLYFRRPET